MSHFCHECQQPVDLVSADNNVYCRECHSEFIEQLPGRFNRSTMPVNIIENIFNHIMYQVDGPPTFQMIFEPFSRRDDITRHFDQLRGDLGGFGDFALGEHNFNDILARLMEQADQEQSARLSPEDIVRLPMTQVSEKQVINGVQCITCMESFVLDERVVVLECEHIFHRECIEPWLRLHNTCPICRSVIDPHKWSTNSTFDTWELD